MAPRFPEDCSLSFCKRRFGLQPLRLQVHGLSMATSQSMLKQQFFRHSSCLFRLSRVLTVALLATTPSAMSEQEQRQRELQIAVSQYRNQQNETRTNVYSAARDLWFNQRRKRAPPTPASSSLATPQEDQEMGEPEAAALATPHQEVGLPITLDANAALTATAAHATVDVKNPQALQQWLDEPVGTRRQVLDTVSQYHAGVIRTEMYNLMTQVVSVVKRLDNRLLRQQDNLQWLTTEQKKASGLRILLIGWDPTMSPEDRHVVVAWMFQQVQFIRTWSEHRGFTNLDQDQVLFQVFQVDPATAPSGKQWSTITILTFKAWDL